MAKMLAADAVLRGGQCLCPDPWRLRFRRGNTSNANSAKPASTRSPRSPRTSSSPTSRSTSWACRGRFVVLRGVAMQGSSGCVWIQPKPPLPMPYTCFTVCPQSRGNPAPGPRNPLPKRSVSTEKAPPRPLWPGRPGVCPKASPKGQCGRLEAAPSSPRHQSDPLGDHTKPDFRTGLRGVEHGRDDILAGAVRRRSINDRLGQKRCGSSFPRRHSIFAMTALIMRGRRPAPEHDGERGLPPCIATQPV